jgi:hypothetical protein
MPQLDIDLDEPRRIMYQDIVEEIDEGRTRQMLAEMLEEPLNDCVTRLYDNKDRLE